MKKFKTKKKITKRNQKLFNPKRKIKKILEKANDQRMEKSIKR